MVDSWVNNWRLYTLFLVNHQQGTVFQLVNRDVCKLQQHVLTPGDDALEHESTAIRTGSSRNRLFLSQRFDQERTPFGDDEMMMVWWCHLWCFGLVPLVDRSSEQFLAGAPLCWRPFPGAKQQRLNENKHCKVKLRFFKFYRFFMRDCF